MDSSRPRERTARLSEVQEPVLEQAATVGEGRVAYNLT